MQLPVRFGKYELLEFLGGGMSRVYKARDTVLQRTVAVKILTPEGIADEDTRTRFLQEAKVSAALVHDHIIRIFDYGEEQGYPFIVMEFLVGSDLKGAIRDKRLGDDANRLRIALEGARALEYVHQHKLIHRDIKPDNLHVDEKGRVRLMDFGIAKSEDVSLTKTGFQVGTPFYMSPEQVNGDKATERTDVYSYGMVLYELYSGTRAIQGTTIQTIFAAILHQPVDMARMREGGAPGALVALVERMTAKDPMARPASFGEVIAALESIAAGVTPLAAAAAAPAAPAGAISGRKLILGLLAAAVLLSLVVTGLVIQSRNRMAGVKDGATPPPRRQTETGGMLLIPGGAFRFGKERMEVALPAFYMDETEAPNEHFNRYLEARGKPVDEQRRAAHGRLPAVYVTFDEAKDYCAWAGKRLPLPLEWEKAARGKDGQIFPWGPEEDVTKANVGGHGAAKDGPVEVDSMPSSASPYGILHLGGNVWEWVDEARNPTAAAEASLRKFLDPPPSAGEAWHLLKGGSFGQPIGAARAYEFLLMVGRARLPDVGFRCVWVPKAD